MEILDSYQNSLSRSGIDNKNADKITQADDQGNYEVPQLDNSVSSECNVHKHDSKLKCNELNESEAKRRLPGNSSTFKEVRNSKTNSQSDIRYIDGHLDLSNMNSLQETAKTVEKKIRQQNLEHKTEIQLRMKIKTLIEEIIRLKLLNKQKETLCSHCSSSDEMHSPRETNRSSKVTEALITENICLRKQIKDLKTAISKWQKHFIDISKSQEKLNSLFPQEENAEKLLQSFSEIETLRNSRKLCQDNTVSLQDYQDIVSENFRLTEINKNLNETVDLLQLKLQGKNDEYVDILEMQLKIYKEDFDSEHKEKLAEQVKAQEMKQQLEEYRKKIVEGQGIFKEAKRVLFSVFENPRTVSAPECHVSPSSDKLSSEDLGAGPMEKVQHKYSERGTSEEVCDQSKLDIFSPFESWVPVDKEDFEEENTVKCPSCAKTFPPKYHYLFLEHFSTCQKQ